MREELGKARFHFGFDTCFVLVTIDGVFVCFFHEIYNGVNLKYLIPQMQMYMIRKSFLHSHREMRI